MQPILIANNLEIIESNQSQEATQNFHTNYKLEQDKKKEIIVDLNRWRQLDRLSPDQSQKEKKRIYYTLR